MADTSATSDQPPASAVKHFSTFLPLTLFGLALIILLGNDILTLKTEIEVASATLAERAEAATQAEKQYQRLQKLIADTVALGQTDEAAARVVQAYNLKARVQTEAARENE